jgi:hypothetical protein
MLRKQADQRGGVRVNDSTPKRHHDDELVLSMLKEHLPDMEWIVHHRRGGTPDVDGRATVKRCVAVLISEEPDGVESITVVGDSQTGHLELKGVLHDGLYAIAHEGEPGFE